MFHEYISYIKTLPLNDHPALFGLHENADISCAQAETYSCLETLLSLQPKEIADEAASVDEVTSKLAQDILQTVPQPFDLDAIQKVSVLAYPKSRNPFKGSFSCKRGFSLLNFERGLKKKYGLSDLETLCSYYSLLETATVLILCKNIESFLRHDCSKLDMLFSQR